MAGHVFVTGATGHTGARLARRLLADGREVRCLARAGESRRHLPADARLEIVDGDLARDGAAGAWRERLRGCEAVLHVAHISFAGAIVEACKRTGVSRLIAVSSTRRFTKFPDATSGRVIEGEALIEASGLRWTILRPSMIYGGARDNNLERIRRWFLRRRVFPLVRGGRNLVQPVFVDDLVDAMIRALDREAATAGRALTIAGPEAISWREMIETLARGMGVSTIWILVPYWAAFAAAATLERLPGRALATRGQIRRLLEDKAFDIAEAREALGGWTPRPFAEGVRAKLLLPDGD